MALLANQTSRAYLRSQGLLFDPHKDSTANKKETELEELMARYEAATTEATEATEARYEEAKGIAQENIDLYESGEFGAGALAAYESQKKKDVGTQRSNLISSGLFGSTVSGGLEAAYEAEVGVPLKAQLEDIRQTRLAAAKQSLVDIISSRSDIPPEASLYANLIQASYSA